MISLLGPSSIGANLDSQWFGFTLSRKAALLDDIKA